MSYDIHLLEPVTKKVIVLDNPHDVNGGTYKLGGTKELWLNVTYNYAPIFRRVLGEKGIRSIYGMTGADSIPKLCMAIQQLKSDPHPDYWEPTDGNAQLALVGLLKFAVLRPDGIWDGD